MAFNLRVPKNIKIMFAVVVAFHLAGIFIPKLMNGDNTGSRRSDLKTNSSEKE